MSKYSVIADKLMDEIAHGRFSDSGKLPTEFELVDMYGVSRQTIRQAISVLKSEGIVYQVQGSGTYISRSSTVARRGVESLFKNIFIICTYISEYIFPSIIRGIESTLGGTNYRFNLGATGNKVDLERKILTDVLKMKEVDGIILEGSKTGFPNPNIGLYMKLQELGIPVLFLHCAYQELADSVVVGMDDKAGGKIAAKRLVGEGCRKIMGIFKSDDRQGLLRYAGFTEGLLESGIGLSSSEVRWYTTEDIADRGMSLDRNMIEIILNTGIDGIVCYNDQVASMIVRDFTRNGFPLPKLMSFDDSYLCRNSAVPFESLGHRKEELGVIAAHKIRNMVEGKKETSVFLDWIV
jgi:GntR family transcriptional regulator of arabinose operon